MTVKDRSGDRRLLGMIAIGAIVLLLTVVICTFVWGGELSKEAWGLLGVVVGGVISHPAQVISAIKESWLSRSNDRLGAALHASAPDPTSAAQTNMRAELPEVEFGKDAP